MTWITCPHCFKVNGHEPGCPTPVSSPRAEAPQQDVRHQREGECIHCIPLEGGCEKCAEMFAASRQSDSQEVREALWRHLCAIVQFTPFTDAEWAIVRESEVGAWVNYRHMADAILSQFSVAPRKENQ
jgi:hypothetical protein